MIVATPPPAIKIGVACVAKSISMTIRLDKATYRITTIEVCGNKVVLRGHRTTR